MESDQGKNRKMIKKANNNNKKGMYGIESERKDSEEENMRWKDSKGLVENPRKLEGKKDNNDSTRKIQQEKKKFVAGKLRIVEGLEGPTPKMIEVEAEIKGTKRSTKATRVKKKLALNKSKLKQIASMQMEGEEMGLSFPGGQETYGSAGVLSTQLDGTGGEVDGTGGESDGYEEVGKGGSLYGSEGDDERLERDNKRYDSNIGDYDNAENMEGDEEEEEGGSIMFSPFKTDREASVNTNDKGRIGGGQQGMDMNVGGGWRVSGTAKKS
jgi:hypothetical protein